MKSYCTILGRKKINNVLRKKTVVDPLNQLIKRRDFPITIHTPVTVGSEQQQFIVITSKSNTV